MPTIYKPQNTKEHVLQPEHQWEQTCKEHTWEGDCATMAPFEGKGTPRDTGSSISSQR